LYFSASVTINHVGWIIRVGDESASKLGGNGTIKEMKQLTCWLSSSLVLPRKRYGSRKIILLPPFNHTGKIDYSCMHCKEY